jgi:hypothetical protein
MMRTIWKKTAAHPLISMVVAVSDLTAADQEAMFTLMQSYYQHTCRAGFFSDLHDKNDVIVLREQYSGRLVGFSTLKYFELNHISEKSIGVFSGDTIVDQKYWGCTSLQKSFLVQLCKLKFKHNGSKLYWFLISKGYKTYLLMANNFPVYYPRLDEPTPQIFKDMMAEVYSQLYPDTYQAECDTIRNAGKSYCLKEGVAAPTESLIRRLPKVQYFVEKNPQWQAGDELACIAEMDYSVLVRYLAKSMKKGLGLTSSSPR